MPYYPLVCYRVQNNSRHVTDNNQGQEKPGVTIRGGAHADDRARPVRCRFVCRQINCYPVYLLKRGSAIDREHAARSIHRSSPPPPPSPRIITILRGERLLITRDYICCILISVKRASDILNGPEGAPSKRVELDKS